MTDAVNGETLETRLARVLSEKVELAPYDPSWPVSFEEEKTRLLACLPQGLVRSVEHYGSTAVPGLAAKPIIDMLVEIKNVETATREVPPILERRGYECILRALGEDGGPPHDLWCIRRDAEGRRTHHIHMMEPNAFIEEGLAFRDHLRAHPERAAAYLQLKRSLAKRFPDDRMAYTTGKSNFIAETLG